MVLNVLTTLCVLVGLTAACTGQSAPTVGCDARSPLLRAACAGALDDVVALLDGGADADTRGEHGWTPLHQAAAHGHADLARLLADRGAAIDARADYDMRPLHWAALRGHDDVVRALLATGAAVEPRNLYGMTPLHEAATGEVARALLDAGAAVESTDHRGNTPLHLARAPEVAKALIDAGADMLAQARDRSRPVDAATATSENRFEIVLSPESRVIHLPDERGNFRVALRSFATRALSELTMTLTSEVCTSQVTPARVPELHPGQLVVFQLELARKADSGTTGPARLALRGHGQPMMFVDLEIDDRPRDRDNRLTVGRVRVQPTSHWQLLVYLAVPLLLVAGWLGLRSRRR